MRQLRLPLPLLCRPWPSVSPCARLRDAKAFPAARLCPSRRRGPNLRLRLRWQLPERPRGLGSGKRAQARTCAAGVTVLMLTLCKGQSELDIFPHVEEAA
ncbi:hypothetical protein Y1Q_0007477 [Alligator mississippiensis]|uniref:Uncharacterized protein n=1 Tax=Alligator mississippiensis TaxID=8496 RepID=A0A151M4U5_ALLMI|nr:hypothetical protein Y1Q_0007477 [Alligator mississippiensis]